MHPNISHQFIPCFYDLFLTMPPQQSGLAMKAIDQLDRANRNQLLEQFDQRKERYPTRPTDSRLLFIDKFFSPLCVAAQVNCLLEQYWQARRQYQGGYYLRYLPPPLKYQSFATYCQEQKAWLRPLLDQMLNLQHEPDNFLDLIDLLQAINNKNQHDNE